MRNLPVEESVKGKRKSVKSKFKIKNFAVYVLVLYFSFFVLRLAHAAPCYGTRLPEKHKFVAGFEYYGLFKRYLEDHYGKMRSNQEFFLLSFGIFDWLSIDLKGGTGDIRQRPETSSEVDYSLGFAGGYGLRLKFWDKDKVKAVLGFQHTSVHPKRAYVNDVKNRAILDDWQWSLLASYEFKHITPYLGTRWSRVDYIHRFGEDHKRVMSDFTRDIGFIYGFDIPLTQKIWLNLEGSSFDSEALAVSVKYAF